MRDKYYKINAYIEAMDARFDIYSTDNGVMAWIMWLKIKFSKSYKYQIMTIRGK